MSLKRVVLLTASTDTSSVRIAESLLLTAKRNFSNIKLVYIDAMKYIPTIYRGIYKDTYQTVIRRNPALWGYMYNKASSPKLTDLKFTFNEWFAQGVNKKIKELYPDIILCTHFLPAETLCKLKEKYAEKYAVLISDLDIHWLWVLRNIDIFFLPNNESFYRLSEKGIPKDKIKVTGIPVMPNFFSLGENSKVDLRKQLGVDESKFTIFVTSGGYGVGDVDVVSDVILSEFNNEVQVIAYSDKSNAKVKKSLEKLIQKYGNNFKIIESSRKIENVMCASDFAITRSSGYFASQCMCAGLPIMIINPAPGNEERNADYLVESGVAKKIYDEAGIKYKIRKLVNNRELLEEMSKKMLKMAKPNACNNILQGLLNI